MRVLLADPPRRGSYYHAFFPNLGLLYLVSSLRERFGPDIRVKVLDGHRDLEDHLRSVGDFRPDIYGLSFAAFTAKPAFEVMRRVKERFPGLPVVCGGAMPTASPRKVLEESEADICVRGEGEDAVCDLVGYFQDGRRRLEDIPGLMFRSGAGEVYETSPRPPRGNIDGFPLPPWEEVDFRRYKGWHIRRASPQSILLASRGCPHDCVYCSNPVWKYAKPWVRLRSPESIAGEVRMLHGLGVREIYISADEFNVEEKWAIEVCRAIAALGLKNLYFNANLRPDIVTPALARAFKEINLWMAHLGIESGNQATLDGVGKKVKLEQVVEACRVLKSAGVKVFGFVMLYHAWEEEGALRFESARDVDRTLDFCRRLFRAGLMDTMSWQVATPMPGSRLWDLARRHNLLPGHDVRSVLCLNMALPGVSKRQVNRSLRRGLWLKGMSLLRRGSFSLGHHTALLANLKVLLGFGPPRGAY